jgi:hypothetical protein
VFLQRDDNFDSRRARAPAVRASPRGARRSRGAATAVVCALVLLRISGGTGSWELEEVDEDLVAVSGLAVASFEAFEAFGADNVDVKADRAFLEEQLRVLADDEEVDVLVFFGSAGAERLARDRGEGFTAFAGAW